MRHIADTTDPLRAVRRGRSRARIAVMPDGRDTLARAVRLMLPLLLLLFLALGQAASAHQGNGPHHQQAAQTTSHHADAADVACCGEATKDADSRDCLAKCLASCTYCAPVPLPANFPDVSVNAPRPTPAEPLRGAIASPHPRPPSLS